MITDLQTSRRTEPHFKALRTLSPLMCKIPPPPVLQMELIDLQCNSALKVNFREVSGEADKLGKFLRELPPNFPELSRMLKRTMCLFGSTYLCEKLFSTLNFNKSKYRSRLTNEHLQAVLRVSTASSLKANVARLCENKRSQISTSKM